MEHDVQQVVSEGLGSKGLPGEPVEQELHRRVVHDRDRRGTQRVEKDQQILGVQLVDVGVVPDVVEVVRNEGPVEGRPVEGENGSQEGGEEQRPASG